MGNDDPENHYDITIIPFPVNIWTYGGVHILWVKNHKPSHCLMMFHGSKTSHLRRSWGRLMIGLPTLCRMGSRLPGLGKLSLFLTSPNYWGSNLQQIFEGDVQNPQLSGHLPNPAVR